METAPYLITVVCIFGAFSTKNNRIKLAFWFIILVEILVIVGWL